MNIVMATSGTRGDVQPLIALALALKKDGHSVVLFAPPNFESWIRSYHLDFYSCGINSEERMQEQARNVVGGHFKSLKVMNDHMKDDVEGQFAAAEKYLHFNKTDLIIGAALQVALPSYAELHQIPYRYVAYCSGILPNDENGPFTIPFQNLPKLMNRILWKGTLAGYDLLLNKPINQARKKLGLGSIQGFTRYLFGETILLACDPLLSPPPKTIKTVQTGAWLLPQQNTSSFPNSEDLEIEAFLKSGPPPLYFGFGSMSDHDPESTVKCILEAVKETRSRALIYQGWAGFKPLQKLVNPSILFIGPTDHRTLFPRMAAIVHHGGAGTTAVAARAGVPQILIPHLVDQPYWANRLLKVGAAPPPIPRRSFRKDRLVAAIRTIRHSKIKKRAKELSLQLDDGGIQRAIQHINNII